MKHLIQILILLQIVFISSCSGEAPEITEIPEQTIYDLIAKSDDLSTHSQQFFKATKDLIHDGSCNIAELKEQGGWMKSVINYKDEPVYFLYCGGFKRDNRIYLNVDSGKIFQ